jgi:hypothetical protein
MVVYDGLIQDLDVFVWELEPVDTTRRSAREWVYEHITSRQILDYLLNDLGWDGECVAFEAVFKGRIEGRFDYFDEWDEELIVEEHISQPLPEKWFESPFGDGL